MGSRQRHGTATRRPIITLALSVIAAAGVVLVPATSAAPVAVQRTADAETAFTIAQVPDTQQEVLSDTDPLLPTRYQWLADNAQQLNLKYVAHTGDVVNWGAVDPPQFTRAGTATSILDNAGIPYGNAVGNHDTAAVQAGGSAGPGNVRDNLRNTTAFNQTFPASRFRLVGGVFEDGKSDNMFQTFTAGGVNWLVLTHEMWPRQSVLDWAKQVVSSHPRYNVIVNTHAFLNNQGERPTAGNYGDQNAQAEWDQLISQYPNIKMVLSGHYGPTGDYGGYNYSEATGVNGNKIAEIMTAYHSSYQDHTRLLRIDTANNTISSSVYVARSTNAAYPSGYITDSASNFTTTGMNWIPPQEPVSAPSVPTGVSANADDGRAAVSFTAPGSTGGAPVTGYTVTASPGGATATGASGPLTVTGLTNGTAYTFTVTATNGAGTSPPSAPSGAVVPSRELLPDPGFEAGNGGWVAFAVGTLSRVDTPLRGGVKALDVAATSNSPYLVGLTQNTVVSNSEAGRQYAAQCWVRPVGANQKIQIRLLEYTQNFSANTMIGQTVIQKLPTDVWTLVRTTGTAASTGKRIVPQIYSTTQTTATGSIRYDDCSLR